MKNNLNIEKVRIEELMELLSFVKEQGFDFVSIKDEKDIFLALQSYNYGIGYIKYVEQTDKQYTYQNAIAFSQKCKKEYNVSVYGDSKYVYHVLRYYTDTSLVDDWLELYR